MAPRDDWKSITMDSGDQSAIIVSTILMLELSVIVLDTGRYILLDSVLCCQSFSVHFLSVLSLTTK